MIVFIHISLSWCFGGQTSEWAATVGFHGVVKCLIRALVPKPISKCLLVGHSFCRLPIQNWDLKKGLFWSHFLVEGFYLKTSPHLERHMMSAVRDEHPVVTESLNMIYINWICLFFNYLQAMIVSEKLRKRLNPFRWWEAPRLVAGQVGTIQPSRSPRRQVAGQGEGCKDAPALFNIIICHVLCSVTAPPRGGVHGCTCTF